MQGATLIEGALPSAFVQELLARLRERPFRAGRETAPNQRAGHKGSEQLTPKDPVAAKAGAEILATLGRHPEFNPATLSARTSLPTFARYTEGAGYGPHCDAAIMGQAPNLLRTDLAMTVWLSAPEHYEGGELVVHREREYAFKPRAGSALIYPAHFRHEVRPVTRGTRLVAITWMQSLVRDAEQRELLQRFNQLHGALPERTRDEAGELYNRLLRMWANPS